MSKATLLTSATTEPSVSTGRGSELTDVVRPTLKFTQQSQRAITSVAIFLILRVWACLNTSLLTGLALARQSLRVSKFSIIKSAAFALWVWKTMWATKPGKQFQRKLEMEMQSLLFGPVGNGLALLLLWPGWILVLLAWISWKCIAMRSRDAEFSPH